MQRKIFIHVGAHKSASTTLQVNLNNHKDTLLKDYNLEYIGPAEIAYNNIGEHFRKLSRGDLNNEKDYKDSLFMTRDFFINNYMSHNKSSDLFFSWEGFLGHSALNSYKGIYTNANKVAESLNYIFLEKIDSLLLVIRRQDEFIESCYLQQIKECKTLSFDEFTSNLEIEKLSWHFVINSLDKASRKIKVVPFELLKSIGTKSFLEVCVSLTIDNEFNLKEGTVIDHLNPSLSDYGVKKSRELLPLVHPSLRKDLNKILFSQLSNLKHPKAIFFNDFTRKLILSMYSNENEKIFNQHLLEKKHISGPLKEHISNIKKLWLDE